MRIPSLLLLLSLSPSLADPRTGDVIFHSSRSAQSRDIEAVTGSRFSHCGVVEVTPEGTFVWEAAGTVRRRPFMNFAEAGRGHRYELLRLERPLGESALSHMSAELRRLEGRPYDRLFQPGDARIYCSELVWLVYKAAGIELCAMRRFGSYPIARRMEAIRQRWGKDPPLDQLMVSPQDLADSEHLVPVGD